MWGPILPGGLSATVRQEPHLVADDLPCRRPGAGRGGRRAPTMAEPVPGPMTPTGSPSPAMAEVVDENDVPGQPLSGRRSDRWRGGKIFPVMRRGEPYTAEKPPGSRKRLRSGGPIVPLFMVSPEEKDMAMVSTVSSTPGFTSSSPLLSPSKPPDEEVPHATAKDYSSMSLEQLREELLGPGAEQEDSVAFGWPRHDLIAVLEEMDKLCMPPLGDLHL